MTQSVRGLLVGGESGTQSVKGLLKGVASRIQSGQSVRGLSVGGESGTQSGQNERGVVIQSRSGWSQSLGRVQKKGH